MADDQYGDSWKPQSSLGTGEGESPLATPPAPSIDMRTMSSDVKSIEESGGGVPRPYVPPPPMPGSSPKPETPKEESFAPPGIATAEMPPTPPASFPTATGGTPKSKKTLFGVVVIVLLIAGFAAVGYYFVYPYLFANAPVTPAPTPETPLPTPPVNPPAPTSETPPPQGITHISFFKTAADTVQTPTLATLEPGGLGILFSTAAVPTLTEVIFRGSDGNVLSFSQIVSMLAPTTFTADVTKSFEDDATFFTYANGKGTWLGIIAKAKPDAALGTLETNVAKIEQSSEVNNFFLTNPGTPGVWKDGTTSGVTSRYITFSLAGAGFNYGWSGNFLVVSGSYDGFKEALKRLQ